MIELIGATFGYAGREVLTRVDLSVGPGEVVGILGPNGAGKTTLMRGLLGLLKPMGGRVVDRTERVGYVPQRESLDPLFPLSVREVVEMGCYGRLFGWRRPTREDQELVEASLVRVGLQDAARKPFSALSGGQRQRALLARALVMKPEVLFLDEPTSGVDAATTREIFGLLEELAANDSIAILLVTHQVAPLRGSTSEVLWVADGAVERKATEEFLDPERLEALLFGGGAL